MIKCGIIGAGAWGTAISTLIKSTEIYIWSRNKKTVNLINNKKINPYLQKINLQKNLIATSSLYDLKDCKYFFIVTPTQYTKLILKNLSKYKINNNFIICSKGIENKSGKLLSSIIEEIFPKSNIAILSGPSFAGEVAKNLPTAVTLACKQRNYFNKINKLIYKKSFRIYYGKDLIGTQLGGALKNVYAIGAGIINGLKLGENARSAFIARSFVEILRLGKKLGAKEKTFFGLSCLGDLMLTCNSQQSRNVKFGQAIVVNNKKRIKKILKENKSITEGYFTTQAIYKISRKHKVEMPIARSIYRILYLKTNIKKEIKLILNRSIKKEFY